MIQLQTTEESLEKLGLRLQKRSSRSENYVGRIGDRRVDVTIAANDPDDPPSIAHGTAQLEIIIDAPGVETSARIGKRVESKRRNADISLDELYYFSSSPQWTMSVVHDDSIQPTLLRLCEPIAGIDREPAIIVEPGHLKLHIPVLDRALLNADYFDQRLADALALTDAIERVPPAPTPGIQSLRGELVHRVNHMTLSATQIIGLLLIAIAVLSSIGIAINSKPHS